MSQHTDTSNNRTPGLHQSVVMRCIIMQGLSSAVISSSCDSIHPPELEINPLKTARGCPHGRVIENTRSPLTLWNAFVNVQLHIPSVQLRRNDGTSFFNVQSTMMSVSGPVFSWECYNNNIIILQKAHHINPVH